MKLEINFTLPQQPKPEVKPQVVPLPDLPVAPARKVPQRRTPFRPAAVPWLTPDPSQSPVADPQKWGREATSHRGHH